MQMFEKVRDHYLTIHKLEDILKVIIDTRARKISAMLSGYVSLEK